jgi:L-threonylcarbamoyladenylate synthase
VTPPAGPAPRWRLSRRGGEPLPSLAPLARLLARGGVLALPTESSYGLGADPWSDRGVEAVLRFKGERGDKPLPVVVAGIGQLVGLGIDPELAAVRRLAGVWPAPLTAVLPVARPLPATLGRSTLAVRVPAHPELRELLAALGTPLTATSANPSGGAPVLDPEQAAALLAGEDALVLDGGPLPGGAPSTLVAFADPAAAGPLQYRVLRAGAYPVAALAAVFG